MTEEENEDRLKAIGNRIKELRIRAGYSSIETFANDHNLSRRNYWRLESGGDFKMSTLLRIVEIHNISMETFFKGVQ